MTMTEKEASQVLRGFLHDADEVGDDAPQEKRAALAYLDVLERNYLDTKASRDEDDHARLVKFISLDGKMRTQIAIAGVSLRNILRASMTIEAGRTAVASLHLVGYDESKFGAWQGPQPPTIETDIELTSFVFRGVR